MGDDDPIDPMYLGTGFGGGYSDPLVERLLACDLRSDDAWGIGAPSFEMDHFARENDRFGLLLDCTFQSCSFAVLLRGNYVNGHVTGK